MKRILNFKGEIPKVGASLLPESNAQIAQGAKLWSGLLRAIKDTLSVNTPSKPGAITSIYRWGATAGNDAEKAITGATKANPVVITSNAHGLNNGERVFITGVGGMTQINDRTFVVANKTTNTYELQGENGTTHGSYTSGGTWVKQNGYWF